MSETPVRVRDTTSCRRASHSLNYTHPLCMEELESSDKPVRQLYTSSTLGSCKTSTVPPLLLEPLT